MPGRATQQCPHREAVEALAHDALTDDQRRETQKHLEQCEDCRAHFRKKTGGWFPTLRDYTVVERIGEGGFGVVYKAIHHAKQRTEALKVLFGKTAARAAYFQNEVHLIAKLRHANIATLYEAHLASQPYYYTMEFVEGEHLDDYLHSQEVSLAERIEIIRSVALAVDYAHEQGVVHRDIKPANILIDAASQPRIIDFGIAKKRGLEEAEGGEAGSGSASPEGMVGTFGYIAPEQLAGEQTDRRADVYSLGALLYHCVTGEPARFAEQSEHLVRLLQRRRVNRADDLAAIITRCVQAEPDQRYQTCTEFVEDLENYLAARPIAAREDQSARYRAARIAGVVLRNNPYTVRVAVLLAVVALLSLTFSMLKASWLTPGSAESETALITFTPDTMAALREGRIGGDVKGLDLENTKSLRLLHGKLMERLAATKPRVVAMDFWGHDAQPDFDPGFVRGVKALKASQVPVVVGTGIYDVDGKPALSPAIRDVVHACGLLHSTSPGDFSGSYVVPLCIPRGLAPPAPSLSVAAFAAARFPDSDLDLRLSASEVTLCYRKRHPYAGESTWRTETDSFPIGAVVKDYGELFSDPADMAICTRVRAGERSVPQVAYEDVLTADDEQLQRWFHQRAIMVGQMIPPMDLHTTAEGESIFGCEVQAQALDWLLSGTRQRPFTRGELLVRIALWCALAGMLIGVLRPGGNLPLHFVTGGCALVFLVGLCIAVYSAAWVTTVWKIEAAIAVCSLLAAGSAAYLPKDIRERQLQLTPGEDWSPDESPPSTTLLADSSGRAFGD